MNKNTNKTEAASLRQKAEEKLKFLTDIASKVSGKDSPEADILKLLQELQVHQIELEMQNEELLTAKVEAEQAMEKYSHFYDFAPLGYITLSKLGNIEQLNFSAAKMLGNKCSLFVNKRFGLYVSLDTRPTYHLFLEKVFKSELNQKCEIVLVSEGNLPIQILMEGIISNNGNECILYLIDITERKQIESELREKAIQYRNLADSGLALIWTAGTDKLCNYFNQPWLNFTGRTLEQEMGNGWAEGVHPDDFNKCLNIYITAFDKQVSFDMEYRLRNATGEYCWIRDMGTPNTNASGEFNGYIGHCFDINLQKNTEDELRKKSDELKYVNSLFIGRELKMVELKKEINELLKKAGDLDKYVIHV